MSTAKKRLDPAASGAQSTTAKGRMIEAIVASMHENNGVKVERNAKLAPIGSQGPEREIDVLLSAEVCGYPVRWAVECKNQKKRIGVEYIDALVGKLHDVGIPPQFGVTTFFRTIFPAKPKRSLLLAPLDVGTVRPADEIDKYSGQSVC